MQLDGGEIMLQAVSESDKDDFYTMATKSDGARFWYDEDEREMRSKTAFFEDWTEGYFDVGKPDSGQCFWIIAEGKKVGVIAYNIIDEKSKKSELDIIIGSEEDMGKGYGSAAIKTLCKYLFEELKLNKVWIEARGNNPRAIQAYQKAGFKKEGVLREDDFFQGEFVDSVRLGMLSKDF